MKATVIMPHVYRAYSVDKYSCIVETEMVHLVAKADGRILAHNFKFRWTENGLERAEKLMARVQDNGNEINPQHWDAFVGATEQIEESIMETMAELEAEYSAEMSSAN